MHQGCFIVMTLKAYPERTTIWSNCLAVGDITSVVAQDALVAPASQVVRGSVQIVTAIATQLRSFTATELATVSIEAWRSVRADLNRHQHKRNQQRQFRRSPATYLAALEQKFLQLALPP